VSAGDVADGEDVAHLKDLCFLHTERLTLRKLYVSGDASGRMYWTNA
jgi:hypothetical protein